MSYMTECTGVQPVVLAKELFRAKLVQYVKRTMPSYISKHIDGAVQGDAMAAGMLNISLSDADRGDMAIWLWQAKVPLSAYRPFLSSTWMHDHRYLVRAAQTRRRLASMFRYAAFPLPEELPETVRVWRGTTKLSLHQAKRGYAWTTNRDVAFWFAARFAKYNGSPLLLAADIAKTDIALFTNDRKESEAVLMHCPRNAWVDSHPHDFESLGNLEYPSTEATCQTGGHHAP